MSNTTRIIITLVCTAALAALATPALASAMPPYLPSALAAALAAVLQQTKPLGPQDEPKDGDK